MVDAAKQEPLVVWSRQETSRDGRDAQLHFQTVDTCFQESAAQKERALKKSHLGTRARLVDSTRHDEFTNEYQQWAGQLYS